MAYGLEHASIAVNACRVDLWEGIQRISPGVSFRRKAPVSRRDQAAVIQPPSPKIRWRLLVYVEQQSNSRYSLFSPHPQTRMQTMDFNAKHEYPMVAGIARLSHAWSHI